MCNAFSWSLTIIDWKCPPSRHVPARIGQLACGLRRLGQMYPIGTVMTRLLSLFCLLGLAALTPAVAGTASKADPRAVSRIEGGIVDCPGCQLQGANLVNTCVKAKDLHGANFDGANASLMCMSFANFKGASFRRTNLDAAN